MSATMAKAASVLDNFLRLASLKRVTKLRKIQCERELYVQYEILSVATTFQTEDTTEPASMGMRLLRHLIWAISNLFIVYVICKSAYLSIIYTQKDGLLTKLTNISTDPIVGPRDKAYCRSQLLVRSNFSHADQKDIHRLIGLNEQLDNLGAPIRSALGLNSMGFMYLAAAGLCFYLLGYWFVGSTRPRLNLASFIRDKEYERKKFVFELKNLIESILLVDKRFEKGGKHHYEYTTMSSKTNPLVFTREGQSRISSQSLLEQQWWLDFGVGRTQKSVIFDRKLHQLIEPEHLSDRWHARICTHISWAPIYSLIMVSPAIGTIIFTIIWELIEKVKWRLFEIHCAHVIKAYYSLEPLLVTLHKARFPLRPLAMTDAGAANVTSIYENFDNGWLAWIYATTIEARLHLFQLRTILTVIELLSLHIILSMWVFLYFIIFIYDTMTTIIWLQQIERQIDECIERLTAKSSLDHELCVRNKILQNLLMSYLNYELFRRDQVNCRAFYNFILLQTTLLTSVALFTCYYTLGVVKSGYNLTLLVLITYNALYVDLYLIASALTTGKIMRLMRNVYRLVALSLDHSIRQTGIVNLWAGQILDDEQTKAYFAPRLFGIALTYDIIVTFNSYVLLSWFLV